MLTQLLSLWFWCYDPPLSPATGPIAYFCSSKSEVLGSITSDWLASSVLKFLPASPGLKSVSCSSESSAKLYLRYAPLFSFGTLISSLSSFLPSFDDQLLSLSLSTCYSTSCSLISSCPIDWNRPCLLLGLFSLFFGLPRLLRDWSLNPWENIELEPMVRPLTNGSKVCGPYAAAS